MTNPIKEFMHTNYQSRIIYSFTFTFSPPLSHLTLSGRPYSFTALSKHRKTVSLLLLVEQCKYTMNREKPSMPPWTTNLHLIDRQGKLIGGFTVI